MLRVWYNIDMEIITGIIIIVVIVGLIVLIGYKDYMYSKERVEMAKVSKVKDVQDLNYVFPSKEVEEEVEEDTRVPLDDIHLEDIMREAE